MYFKNFAGRFCTSSISLHMHKQTRPPVPVFYFTPYLVFLQQLEFENGSLQQLDSKFSVSVLYQHAYSILN